MRTDRHLTSGFEWAYRDLITLMMFSMLILLLLFIVAIVTEGNMKAGELVVQLSWMSCDETRTLDADVDLWVLSPGDDGPVGFPRRTGAVFDLLHDHRGHHVEGDYSNTEFAVARHTPAGKYIINAAAFTSWDNQFPICLKSSVSQPPGAGKGNRTLFQTLSRLTEPQQEITLMTFYVGDDGRPIESSILYNPPKTTFLWRTP
jgi:hypothetical protein